MSYNLKVEGIIENTMQNESRENINLENIKNYLQKIKDSKRYNYYKNNAAIIVIKKNLIYLKGSIDFLFSKKKLEKDFQSVFNYAISNNCSNIKLFLNSAGGVLDSMNYMLEIMKKSPKPIDCYIINRCCSAATIIALECRTISIYHKSIWGIHYIENIKYGKNGQDDIITTIETQKKETLDYYSKKLKLDERQIDQILSESKILHVNDSLKYNFVSNIFYDLPLDFLELNELMIKKIQYKQRRALYISSDKNPKKIGIDTITMILGSDNNIINTPPQSTKMMSPWN